MEINDEYIKFLNTKLYLVECFARKQLLNGKDEYKQILDIVNGSPSKIEELRNKHEF